MSDAKANAIEEINQARQAAMDSLNKAQGDDDKMLEKEKSEDLAHEMDVKKLEGELAVEKEKEDAAISKANQEAALGLENLKDQEKEKAGKIAATKASLHTEEEQAAEEVKIAQDAKDKANVSSMNTGCSCIAVN